jgi:hypothetical protein
MQNVQQAPLAAFAGALLAFALAVPTQALPLTKSGAVSPAVAVAARKGTRNYVPDTPSALPDTATGSARPRDDAKALADCEAIWDSGTHITREKWKAICKRQLKERTELSVH